MEEGCFRAYALELTSFKLLVVGEVLCCERSQHLTLIFVRSYHTYSCLYLALVAIIVHHHLHECHLIFIFNHLSTHLLSQVLLLQLSSQLFDCSNLRCELSFIQINALLGPLLLHLFIQQNQLVVMQFTLVDFLQI